MTDHRIYAEFGGDTEYLPVRSNIAKIQTVANMYRVGFETNKEAGYIYTINEGIRIRTYAYAPNNAGAWHSVENVQIRLEVTSPSGVESVQTQTTTINNNGGFDTTFTLRNTESGIYKVRCVAVGNEEVGTNSTTLHYLQSGPQGTTLTMTANKSTYNAGETITLTPKLLIKGSNTALNNQTIKLYKQGSTTVVATGKTSGNGTCTFTVTADPLNASYYCAFAKTTLYDKSTSDMLTLTVNKYTTSIKIIQSDIYEGHHLVGRLERTTNNSTVEIPNATINAKINDTTPTGTILTNDKGYFKVPVTTPTNKYNYDLTYNGSNYDNNIHINGNGNILTPITVEYVPTNITQIAINPSRERDWYNMSSSNVNKANDNKYITCGTDSRPIASSSGTAKIPAPIRVGGFKCNLKNGSKIKKVLVYWKSRTITHSSSEAPSTYPAFPNTTVRLISYITGGFKELIREGIGTGVMEPQGGYKYTKKAFGYRSIVFEENQCKNIITASTLNSENFAVDIIFNANAMPNTGQLDIDLVCLKVEYIPGESDLP